MFGNNPKRSTINDSGDVLYVKNIFKTIQGEGPLAGTPAVFLRLGGCNLACSFCDTDFENFTPYALDEILYEISRLHYSVDNKLFAPLVVITGGEPLRQSIELCCERLLTSGFTVQIETNGTLYRRLPPEVYIVCSPKAGAKGYSRLRIDLLPSINAIKFLVAKNIDRYSHIAEVGQTDYNIPVFIQPIDQGDDQTNSYNMQLAITIALQTGYRVSMQLHKIWGVD